MNLWERIGNWALGEDEALNALGGGSARQTISGTVGRAVIAGKWWGWILAYGIDGLLGEGHCAKQAAKEALRG